MMTSIFLVIISSVAIATTYAFVNPAVVAEQFEQSDELVDRLQEKRNLECAVLGSKCFNTDQCCGGFICAVLDEEVGDKPEVPGYCVKSKAMKPCTIRVAGSEVGEDCPTSHRCMALGRMGQRYCLPIGQGHRTQLPDLQSIKMTDRRRYHAAAKSTGKLGSLCISDADCAPKSEDGQQRMCCQLVNQGRQGTKRICDRVTQISTCIGA